MTDQLGPIVPNPHGPYDETNAPDDDVRRLHLEPGAWGAEVAATVGEYSLRFVGVGGPRWMLRGAMRAAPSTARRSASALRDLLRGIVVARGAAELPDRTMLPLELPAEFAARIADIPKDDEGLRSFGVL